MRDWRDAAMYIGAVVAALVALILLSVVLAAELGAQTVQIERFEQRADTAIVCTKQGNRTQCANFLLERWWVPPTDTVWVEVPVIVTDTVTVTLPPDTVTVTLPPDTVTVTLPPDTVIVTLPPDTVIVTDTVYVEQPPPPPPVDSDGDGVPDDSDLCPAEFGTDPDGCPEPPPPVDSDGDGIEDDLDLCPTEPGPAPDGCPEPPPPPPPPPDTSGVAAWPIGTNPAAGAGVTVFAAPTDSTGQPWTMVDWSVAYNPTVDTPVGFLLEWPGGQYETTLGYSYIPVGITYGPLRSGYILADAPVCVSPGAPGGPYDTSQKRCGCYANLHPAGSYQCSAP